MRDSAVTSSAAIGAGSIPEPVRSKWPRFQRAMMQREKSAAELNYLAQFLYLDPKRPPVRGGYVAAATVPISLHTSLACCCCRAPRICRGERSAIE